jgi:ribonuclease HI
MKQPSLKQLSFLSEESTTTTWTLFIDGASKHNPGPAGVGIYLANNAVPIIRQGFYVGVATNNQAEYIALLVGAWYAQRSLAKHDKLTIFSDSQLLVKQVQGQYKIKNNELLRMYHAAHSLLASMNYEVQHIMRENNTIADALANEGIKKKYPLPADFVATYRHDLP